MMVTRTTGALVASALFISACSSPSDPGRPPPHLPVSTVQVNNPACSGDTCETMYALIFIWSWLQYIPENPWGIDLIDSVTARTGCITIPGADTLRVRWTDSDGTEHTEEHVWTDDDPDGISLVLGYNVPAARTDAFVPADAPGWNLTLVDSAANGMQYTAHLSPDSVACWPTS